ncbi:MAG: alpha/beta hydrolase [Akkermansiaceae bacterium]|nr:alpha/beta hydrolase [Akkermansiaceae bacterium]
MKCIVTLLATIAVALAESTEKANAFPKFPEDVHVERGVAFLAANRSEKADIYSPINKTTGRRIAAVLHIHGGGFTGGKRDAEREINICSNLARHGYLAMSIDYKLSYNGKASWPQNLYDCKTAVRWLRINAGNLGIDPDRIGVIGGSAGGTLALLVALTTSEDRLDPKDLSSNISCRVSCCVDLYGISDLAKWHDVAMLGKTSAENPALYDQASPITYAKAGAPPMLILHGTADTTVDHHQSIMLANALKAAGTEHELQLIPGATHTFNLQPPQRDLRPLVFEFFDKHLGNTNLQKQVPSDSATQSR